MFIGTIIFHTVMSPWTILVTEAHLLKYLSPALFRFHYQELYLSPVSLLLEPKQNKQKMEISRTFLGSLAFVLLASSVVVHGDPLVPALIIFGDSIVDVGNNNNLVTLVKANIPPYGRDFVTHSPTGRFCNGKLATDFTGCFSEFPLLVSL